MILPHFDFELTYWRLRRRTQRLRGAWRAYVSHARAAAHLHYLYHFGRLPEAHGTDGMAPTMWRQGPYRALVFAGLIEQIGSGFNNSRRWALTAPCRALMRAERAAQLQGSEAEPAAPPPLAPPRQAPAFRALDPGYYSRIPQREGSWDFKKIPSRYADQTTGPKCA